MLSLDTQCPLLEDDGIHGLFYFLSSVLRIYLIKLLPASLCQNLVSGETRPTCSTSTHLNTTSRCQHAFRDNVVDVHRVTADIFFSSSKPQDLKVPRYCLVSRFIILCNFACICLLCMSLLYFHFIFSHYPLFLTEQSNRFPPEKNKVF